MALLQKQICFCLLCMCQTDKINTPDVPVSCTWHPATRHIALLQLLPSCHKSGNSSHNEFHSHQQKLFHSDTRLHTPLTGWARYKHFISVECSSPDYHIDSSNVSACCRCFCLILSIYLRPDMVIRAQSSLSPWPLNLKQTSSN